jgi:hypothetical protein
MNILITVLLITDYFLRFRVHSRLILYTRKSVSIRD